MVNVLLIPTSGLMEFNASAAAGAASATLDNAYANAVRMEIANSATLRFTGKNATNNERIVVSGINGTVLTIRDISAAGGTSGSLETPVAKVTYVSAGTVSATTYLNLPLMGEGQFVDVSGDTMTGRLDLSAAASGTTVLSANGSVLVSGNVSVSSNISAVGVISSTGNQLSLGEMSSAGAHRGTSGIFSETVSAVSSVRSASGLFLTGLSAGPISGGTLTVTGTIQAGGNISGAIFSGASVTVTGTIAAVGNISGSQFSGASLLVTGNASAAQFSGASLLVTGNASATTFSGGNVTVTGTVAAGGNISGATFSGAALTLTGNASVANLSATGNVSSASAFALSSIKTNLSSTNLSAANLSATTVSAANLSATGNVSSASAFALSAVYTNLSATNASVANFSATTVSAANISATGNVSSASAFALSSVVSSASAGSLSATNISALTNLRGGNISGATVTALSATVPNYSGTTINVGTVRAGIVSGTGLADQDLILASLGTGAITLSGPTVNIPNGTLNVTGHFAATSKAFVIDHPTPAKKAAGMKLQYACLEGPENGVYVRGKADTQVGVIELPDYWMDLVHADSITVQLTAMSPAQRLYVAKIEDNKVYVRDASAVSEVTTFFYTVNGERKDIDHLTIEY